ncbi:MAG: hypothetical protein ACYC61_32495, partial [Isosphaeraceae bacterium]
MVLGQNAATDGRRHRPTWLLGIGIVAGQIALGPVAARADEPTAGAKATMSAAALAGKRVVPRHAGLALRAEPEAPGTVPVRSPGRALGGDVYLVEAVKGSTVRL